MRGLCSASGTGFTNVGEIVVNSNDFVPFDGTNRLTYSL